MTQPDEAPEPVSVRGAWPGRGSLRRVARAHPAAVLAVVAAFAFAIVFGALSVRNHDNFGTWSFDMGIYDQGFWLTSRFTESFLTVRGIEFWGQHVNLIVYAFVPFYWLGAGPPFLVAAQAAVVGLGAVPTYLIARDRLHREWIALCFAGAFVMYAPVQWLTEANFHPEALVVTPMLFAWWYARRGRWRPYFISLAIALSTREDVALMVAMLGVVLIVIYWRGLDTDRRAARLTLVIGLGWYLFCTKLFIPHFNHGDEPFYIQYFYSAYGNDMRHVIGTVVRHPNRVVAAAVQSDRVRFYRDLLMPWGGLSLAALPLLVMIVPQMTASVIGSSPYARQIRYQYTSVMLAPIIIAAIEGAAFLIRRFRVNPRGLAVWVLLSAAVSNVAWSPSPWGDYYGIWSRPARHDRRCLPQPSCDNGGNHIAALREALHLVPKNAAVAATFSLLPHLSHRRLIFDWPNPFRPAYWGTNNENQRSPAVIDYIVLDKLHIGPEDQPTVARLTAPGGEFVVLLDRDNVLVARRVRPPDAEVISITPSTILIPPLSPVTPITPSTVGLAPTTSSTIAVSPATSAIGPH